MRFEDFQSSEKVDLIYSATAFHWIKPEIGYTKCKEMLREDGTLALFWNEPKISDNNPDLKLSIQQLYSIYLPDSGPEETYEERCQGIQWFFKHYEYKDVFFKIYKEYRTFTAESYIGLLHTYSNHMALPQNIREEFFMKIYDVIQKFSIIEVEDIIDLHMGRN